MLKFYWRAPHETIYGHANDVCLEQSITIGSNLPVKPYRGTMKEKEKYTVILCTYKLQ